MASLYGGPGVGPRGAPLVAAGRDLPPDGDHRVRRDGHVRGLPAIERELGASLAGAQWTVTAYALAFAVLLLVGGRLADVWGARRMFFAARASSSPARWPARWSHPSTSWSGPGWSRAPAP